MNTIFCALALVLALYALVLSVSYLNQDELIFPRPASSPTSYRNFKPDEFTFDVTQAKLQGWRTEAARPSATEVLIYYGGNAEDSGASLATLKMLAVAQVITVNYRGYGNSTGQPSQHNILADALAIFDNTKQQYPHHKLTVVGRSLGSAVAAHVAANRNVDKLILITPLHSVEKLAREKFYHLLPPPLIKHPFPVAALAPNIKAKTLVLLAENDKVIPKEHSTQTFAALKTQKKLIEIRNTGHNDILSNADAIMYLNIFLREDVQASI